MPPASSYSPRDMQGHPMLASALSPLRRSSVVLQSLPPAFAHNTTCQAFAPSQQQAVALPPTTQYPAQPSLQSHFYPTSHYQPQHQSQALPQYSPASHGYQQQFQPQQHYQQPQPHPHAQPHPHMHAQPHPHMHPHAQPQPHPQYQQQVAPLAYQQSQAQERRLSLPGFAGPVQHHPLGPVTANAATFLPQPLSHEFPFASPAEPRAAAGPRHASPSSLPSTPMTAGPAVAVARNADMLGLPCVQFNQLVKLRGLSADEVHALKVERRRYKNRVYAKRSRDRKHSQPISATPIFQ
jgi:hypothetical protein